MIRIQDLAYRYQERPALKGVSFEISKGEIFGLLGPNGSGKTTLFRILSTALQPDQGDVFFGAGSLTGNLKALRQKIGVVFQSPSLDARLTVSENLEHHGHLYGLSGKDLKKRIHQMLGKLGLENRRKDLVAKLSGGLKRRVEIAKGLLHDPEILLLDEPSTGLDPGARADLWIYLKQLRNEQGITVLLTTHLMEEAERCDRIGILHEGLLMKTGNPEDLKKHSGKDVVLIQSGNPAVLKRKIEEKFSVQASILNGRLQIEDGTTSLMTQIMDAFSEEVTSATIRKPTLEDVYIHETGHRFWTDVEKAVEV